MCRYKTSQGYVLLVVLVFLQLCAWLSLNALQQTATLTRLNREYIARIEAQQAARAAMRYLTADPTLTASTCQMSITMPTILMQQPLSWWQQYACLGDSAGYRYYYMIEPLGEDECAQLAPSVHADFYRVTVLLQEKMLMLQATFAMASKTEKTCSGRIYPVKPGMQAVELSFQ